MTKTPLHLLSIKCRWYKPICFFLIHFCDISGGDLLTTRRAKQSTVILGEINRPLYDSVIVHLNEIAISHFLVESNKALTICTSDFQQVTSSHSFAVGVFINLHVDNLCNIMALALQVYAF